MSITVTVLDDEYEIKDIKQESSGMLCWSRSRFELSLFQKLLTYWD